MHTPSANANLSDSMEMIVQLAKQSMIQVCCVLHVKPNKGCQTADSS